MKFGIQCILIAVIPFIGMSCTEKDDPKSTYDSQRVLECHNQRTWGLDATRNKIIGTWEWKHAEYLYATPPANDLTGMKIEFKNDGTGILTYYEVVPLEFTWSIGTYNTYFRFTTEPAIPYLNGEILFCNNVMLCSMSGTGIADGVNNSYQKVE